MIKDLTYPTAYQIATSHVCGNCASELVIVPIHPDQGKFGLVCSVCREGMKQFVPAGAPQPSLPMFSPRKVQLFWSHVLIVRKPEDGLPDFETCWYWLGSRDEHGRGYGFFRGEDRVYRANRYSYMISHPTQVNFYQGVAAHACHNKPCVNIWHLRNTTNQINILANFWINRLPHLKLDVMSVKQLYLETQLGVKTKDIAKKYQISQWMVNAIRTGKSWYWVTGLPRTYHQYRPSSHIDPAP